LDMHALPIHYQLSTHPSGLVDNNQLRILSGVLPLASCLLRLAVQMDCL